MIQGKRAALLALWLGLLALLFTVPATVPAAAQDSPWRAYVLVGETGQLLEIGPNGEQASYRLGLPEGTFLSAQQMRFSDDGNRAAYCLVTPTAEGPASSTLVIRDIPGETNLIETPLDLRGGCNVSAYDSPNNRIAVSLVNGFPGDTATPDGPLWRLQLLDATTGAVLAELNAASPGAPTSQDLLPDFPEPVPLMAEVKAISGDDITFAAIPWVGIGGLQTLPAYRWNIATGTVTPLDAAWGAFAIDYLPTLGELVYADNDPARPAGNPGGPAPITNVVRLMDAAGTMTTIYHDPAWLVTDVAFINGGQQVAVQQVESFDASNPQPTAAYRIVILNRDGTQVGSLPYPNFVRVRDIPDGFLVMWMDMPTEANPIPATHMDRVDAAGGITRVWDFTPTDGMAAFWELAWATPSAPLAGLTPFPAR